MQMSRRTMLTGSGAALLGLNLPSTASASRTRGRRSDGGDHGHGGGDHGRRPIVIGHRGAPAYRPEHTLASYTLAIEMGPTTSSPTSASPRTASWSRATSRTSAARRTSPTTPSSPAAAGP